MKRSILLPLGFALACHHASAAHPFGRVIARGGELPNVRLEEQKVLITDSAVTAWGMIEVPDGSRLSAAYAGVDAIARSELLKLVRVRIADVMVSVDSTDPARRDAHEHTVEVAGGFLRHAGTTRHGWERVQHPDRVILRVWSRLTVPRAELDAALRSASRQTALQLPEDILEELELEPSP